MSYGYGKMFDGLVPVLVMIFALAIVGAGAIVFIGWKACTTWKVSIERKEGE